MSSSTVYLFGDQTGEVLPAIQELSRLLPMYESLNRFFRQSTDCIRKALARATPQNRQLLSLNDPLELAVAVEKEHKHDPALTAALLCISQLGSIIVHLESNPRALEGSTDDLVLLGICTGLLTATAVSCCRNLTEVLYIAEDVVQLAYQVGLEATRRSTYIDSSRDSWATLVNGVEAEDAQKAIETFNEQVILEPSRQAYISAESVSSLTISGPPPTLLRLFSQDPLFQNCRKVSLPISAAFHASHLEPISWTKMTEGLRIALLEAPVQHSSMISPSSGQPYLGLTFSEVLLEVLHDILQVPISLKAAVQGLHHVLKSPATLVRFGPVNSARTIKKSLEARGIETNEFEDAHRDELAESEIADAIAIVGMSARLPGSETLEEFWHILEEGRDLHEKIRPDRFNVETHCDPSGKIKNTTLTPYGVFIDRPGYFDTRLFNMSPREAAQTDPQQRLMLLTTYEALEMAGYRPNGTPSTNTRRIGSFIGQTSDDYREVNAGQNVDTYFITGGIRAFGPGRLNYHFGWEGPSYSVDTACSSSAASIQLACSALLARECDMAVGGGANFLTASDLFAGLSRGSFLSKTGGCKTFDNDADGYVRADAVGVVVLKRLTNALEDRDNILAVLKGAVTNHSADAISITHPHAGTQERLFTTTLNKAGLQPHDIDYVELHGTGTQAGDATESRSVTNVLSRGRTSPLYIGTVKPNLGHGEAASGVTSLIKAVMMLRKNMIPPHVGIKGQMNKKLPPLAELNTHISFGKTPFHARGTGDGKRRILINNFDAAGGNTSMVIEDAPVLEVYGTDPRIHHVVSVSGKTANSVLHNSRRLLEHIKSHPEVRIEDIAYTTTARRMHHVLRQAHYVSSVEALGRSLEMSIKDQNWSKATSSSPSVTFLFTGQGSSYASMASELFNTNEFFREQIQDYARICESHGFESFLPVIADKGLDISKVSPVQLQLAVVSVELAMAAFWKALGVKPTAVIGHSLGEYPALYTAGVISLSDCLYLVGKRASIMLSNCTSNTHSMLAVQGSAEQVELLLLELRITDCEVACINGPKSTVVSGDVNQISHFQQLLRSKGIKTTYLEVQYAFHSAQMDSVVDDFGKIAERVHFYPPSIPFASTLLGTMVEDHGIIDAHYLKHQTRNRVQFTKALSSLKATISVNDRHLWIETGPNPTCLGLVRSVFGGEEILLLSLKRNENDWKVLSSSVGKAYTAGIDIDWTAYHRPYENSLRLCELPSYAFDLKNYWIQYEGDWAIKKGEMQAIQDTPKSIKKTFSTTSLHRIVSEVSDASGVVVTFETDAAEPKLNKALQGHLVNGAGLCPSSVYADMAFTAAGYVQDVLKSPDDLAMDVRNMEVHKPLLIHPGETRQIVVIRASKAASTDIVEIQFSSRDGQIRQDHAHCIVTLGNEATWRSDWARNSYLVKARMDQLVTSSSVGQTHRILRPMVYKLFAALVDYDRRYQGMEEVYMDSNLLEATANVKFQADDSDGSFTYSPYWIDSIAHLSGFVLNGADTTPADSVFISHGWGSMKILGQLSAEKNYQSYVRMQETTTSGVFSGDVHFFEEGQMIAICQDLKFQRIKRSILDHLLPRTAAHDVPTPMPAASGPAKKMPTPRSKVEAGLRKQSVNMPAQSVFDNILAIIASEVGVDLSELDDSAEFADLGVDSLLSISIVAKLSALLGEDIPTTIFNDYSSVKELGTFFANETSGASTPSADSSDDDDFFSEEGSSILTTASTPMEISSAPGGPSDLFRKIIVMEIGIASEELDETTPLSEYGVDSLLSLAILGAFNAQTGRSLPSSFLMDNPTLAAIQLALSGSLSSASQIEEIVKKGQKKVPSLKAEAVLLQRAALAGPALFLLPDGSGSAGSYVGLPSLKFPGAVYGLNSPFLAAPKRFTVPLNNVAALYVREIRRVQPRGPYHLGGWSIGGAYAFECALQLIQEYGEKVDNLILIDAPCPKTLPPLPLETIGVLESIGIFSGAENKTARSSTDIKIRKDVREHFHGSVNALRQYRPTPILSAQAPRAVKVIWARNGVWETVGNEVRSRYEESLGGENAASDWIMDPRKSYGPNGWDTLLPGANITCEVVTGDHFSMMKKPGITELGSKLNVG
ncbi:hypothetical protein F4677DRAFT_464190 [Hypoxylon crocopeplum]|nr:hypothetical protein F4677DRAFT_464190 [Hypoxylon crocopeplum]